MLTGQDAAVIKGMLARGDKQHDIAAHFGENPARIAEIKNGEKFTDVRAASASLPPQKPHRFIDPKAPLEQQVQQLRDFIKGPPENGRIIVYTPKLSDWILSTLNHQNRKKRSKNIKLFAGAMSAGDWSYTGDTVKFSREGTLLDGQNRFAACVLAGKPFKTLTVFGIEQEAFAKIDTNAVRSNADTMEIVGVPHSRIAAAAVRWIMIEQDRGRSVSNTELHDYYREHIDAEMLQLAIRRAIASGRILPTGSLSALLYQFEKKSKKTMETFATDLAKRVRGARKLMVQVEKLRKENMGRVNELQLQAMIILAWNAYRRNETVLAETVFWNSQTKDFPAIA